MMPKPLNQSLEPTGGDAASTQEEMLSEMQAMLAKQRVVIAELKKQVQELQGESGAIENNAENEGNEGNEIEMAEEVEVSPNTRGSRKTIQEVFEENEKVHMASYVFEQSMWDAALLLCFHHTSVTDKLLLAVGVVLNLSLQTVLLITIYENMLDDPFSDDTVAEMIRWRVTTGHASFDELQGRSKISRLCNRQLWSFEQEAYNEMYDYLYKPMQGIILSSLAIILWVLTIMVEYRRCLEQGLAMLNLPALTADDEFETVDDEGTIEIKGIRPCLRWVALIILCLPRLAVMAFLAFVGCQYLAQTASLSDIVLNAVALAFVLDVDELVANVLLTEKLRGLLPKIAPISCGTTRSAFAPVKDIIRYIITVATILFAFFFWLVPFSQNVEAAAMALCGGYQDFSYSGGVATSPPVILKPKEFGTDTWVTECAETNYEFYTAKYYGLGERNSSRTSLSTAVSRPADYWDTLKLQQVMSFAMASMPTSPSFTSCNVGEILAPQPEDGERVCIPMPESLQQNLPSTVKAGTTELPGQCPRFDTTLGCTPVALPTSCVWSWLSEKCDPGAEGPVTAGPVGGVYQDACHADPPTQCRTWDMFGTPHPTYYCSAVEKCGDYQDYACIAMTGALDILVTSFDDVASQSAVFIKGLILGLKNVTGLDDWSMQLRPLNFEYVAGAGYGSGYGGRRLQGDDSMLVSYVFRNLAYTVFPDVVVASAQSVIDVANSYFLNGTNSSNSSNSTATANFTILSLGFLNSTTTTVQELDYVPSAGDGDGDGDDGGGFGHDGDGDGHDGDGGWTGGDGGDGGDDGDGGDFGGGFN